MARGISNYVYSTSLWIFFLKLNLSLSALFPPSCTCKSYSCLLCCLRQVGISCTKAFNMHLTSGHVIHCARSLIYSEDAQIKMSLQHGARSCFVNPTFYEGPDLLCCLKSTQHGSAGHFTSDNDVRTIV